MENNTATIPARNVNLCTAASAGIDLDQSIRLWLQRKKPRGPDEFTHWSSSHLHCSIFSSLHSLFQAAPKDTFQDKARHGSRDSWHSRGCILKGLWMRPHQGWLSILLSLLKQVQQVLYLQTILHVCQPLRHTTYL